MSKCFQFLIAMALFGCQCEVMVVFRLLFGLKLGNFYFGPIKVNFLRRKYFWMINSNFCKNDVLMLI